MTYSRLTEDAKASRSKLPKELLGDLHECLEYICEHPAEGKVLYGPVRLYKHPSPTFEITYKLDDRQGSLRELPRIDFLHISAPVFRVSRTLLVSSSDEDIAWQRVVLESLEPLQELGIDVWADSGLEPGKVWLDVVEDRLESASAAILLVSEAFLSSPRVRETELPLILDRAGIGEGNGNGFKLLWIPVTHCELEQDVLGRRISRYRPLLDPRTPLAELKGFAKRTKAMTKMQKRIVRALSP